MTGNQKLAILADHVFDGEIVHRTSAVIVDAGRVTAIVPRGEVPERAERFEAPEGAWLAPGFIDVQVNGGGDVLLNDDPTPAAVSRIVAAHRRFGTTSMLPTLITDTREKMRAALLAVQQAAASDPAVLGIHLEGPFISPGRPGIHDPAVIRKPTDADLSLLCERRSMATLVTLAPEEVPEGFIEALVAAGVRVSLGHSMATYEQARQAMACGLTGFTHLFNAMRQLGSRDPGPIAAALESPDVWFGMIVDGRHVDPAMLRLALRGRARPMLVTDAMSPVGGMQPVFRLKGEEIRVEGSACVSGDGVLAGTALDMAQAVRNCVQMLDVPLATALRFASAEPAAFLGLGSTLGMLKPGYRADIVAFKPEDVHVLATWVAGSSSEKDA